MNSKSNTLLNRISPISKAHGEEVSLVKFDPTPNSEIKYNFYTCKFGKIIISNTDIGIYQIEFYDSEELAMIDLIASCPIANFTNCKTELQQNALDFINQKNTVKFQITLHVAATNFQMKVWEALLHIEIGKLATYKGIAEYIGQPKASRAVGTAVGSNSIAFLIPCHRVINTTGKIGNYKWSSERKFEMIEWENHRQDGFI